MHLVLASILSIVVLFMAVLTFLKLYYDNKNNFND